MTNIERLKIHCSTLGIKSDRYVELLSDIEKQPQLMYLTGSDYHNADTLTMWGFLQKVISPILSRDRVYTGNNICYCSIDCELIIN